MNKLFATIHTSLSWIASEVRARYTDVGGEIDRVKSQLEKIKEGIRELEKPVLPTTHLYLGVAGRIGSGKNYLANVIPEFVSDMLNPVSNAPTYTQLAFADALKRMVMEKYSFTREEVYEDKPPHVRKKLMEEGTAGRKQHPDFWVWKLAGEVDNLLASQPRTGIILTDVRYDNERKYLQDQLGGTIFLVQAPARSRMALRGRFQGDDWKQVWENDSETEHLSFAGKPNVVIIKNDVGTTKKHLGNQLYKNWWAKRNNK